MLLFSIRNREWNHRNIVYDRSEQRVPSRVQCMKSSCNLSRASGSCPACGRSLADGSTSKVVLDEELAIHFNGVNSLDPNDPNYWVYLMHDVEIIAEPIKAPTNAGLSFYGTRPTRKLR